MYTAYYVNLNENKHMLVHWRHRNVVYSCTCT